MVGARDRIWGGTWRPSLPEKTIVASGSLVLAGDRKPSVFANKLEEVTQPRTPEWIFLTMEGTGSVPSHYSAV